MNTFTAEDTPAYIVKVFPKASDLFKVQGINFCCKGDIALKDTFAKKAIDGTDVLHALNESYKEWSATGNKAANWDAHSLNDITTYIVDHYHTYLQEELSALGEFVTRIYRVHGHDSAHLEELYTLYNEFIIEAETHLIKEKMEILPMIEIRDTFTKQHISRKVKEWRRSNESMVNLLRKMRETTNNFEPPIDACGSYRITYDRLLELEEKMLDYIYLENNILLNRIVA